MFVSNYLIMVLGIVFLVISYLVYQKYKQGHAKCPGFLSPSLIKPCCSLSLFRKTTKTSTSYQDIVKSFFQNSSVTTFQKNSVIQSSISEQLLNRQFSSFFQWTPLLFYFIPPWLLNTLPNDFSQNETSPYGLISSGWDYWSTIPSKTQVVYQKRFQPLLQSFPISRTISSPLPSTEDWHQYRRPVFSSITDEMNYDLFGALGCHSISMNQGFLLLMKLPIASLELQYWSFTLYLADRYREKDECNPFQHAYFASICPPFNLFHVPPSKRSKSVLNIAIIIAHHIDVVDAIKHQLIDTEIDVYHEFQIPTVPFPIIPNGLANPNQIHPHRSIFQTRTDRWNLLFRIVPKDVNNPSYRHYLQYPDVQVWRVSDIPISLNKKEPFHYENTYPPILPPLTFFSPQLFGTVTKEIHSTLQKVCTWGIYSHSFFPSLTSIYGIGNTEIRQGYWPYENGMMAIQTAGCAQGDNPDAWYKISKPICLCSEKDVVVVVALNHASMKNAYYCNININHTEKAQSLHSVSFFSTSTYQPTFYLVLVSRSLKTINHIIPHLEHKLKDVSLQIFKYVVPGSIEKHDHVQIIERLYLNPSIFFNGKQTWIHDLSADNQYQEKYMTRPDGQKLLTPICWSCRVSSFLK